MNQLTTFDLGVKQLQVVRAMYPLLEQTEFDLFTEYCKRARLDPFRKQITVLVFGAKSKDKSKRRIAFVVQIDGYRSMADRTGNYVPSDKPTHYEIDKKLASPTNPQGIVNATVYVKKYAHGSWHEYSGTAEWSEFAPVEDEWKEDSQTGRRTRTGKQKLGGNWAKMPKLMIAKVAEAQALRRGWPDDLSGMYVEEELDREKHLDLTASEIIEEAEREQREKMIGGPNAITISFHPKESLQRIADGKMVETVDQWARKVAEPTHIEWFMSYNRESLQEFWARHKGDALQVKTILEDRLEELKAKAK